MLTADIIQSRTTPTAHEQVYPCVLRTAANAGCESANELSQGQDVGTSLGIYFPAHRLTGRGYLTGPESQLWRVQRLGTCASPIVQERALWLSGLSSPYKACTNHKNPRFACGEANKKQVPAALYSLFAGPQQPFGPRSDLKLPQDTTFQLLESQILLYLRRHPQ